MSRRGEGTPSVCPYISVFPVGDVVVLGIETATDVCSVGIVRGGAVLAAAHVAVPRSHATRLALLVQETLAHARLTPADLDAVAVSAGPGSYTGLRIGASLARGLSLATGAALVGVGTLDALAAGAQPLLREHETLVVALPSRRGEVYLSVFSAEVRVVEARAVALADVAAVVAASVAAGTPDGPIAVAGAATDAVAAALGEAGYAVRAVGVGPSAVLTARLGAALHASGLGAAPVTFEPSYLGSFATTPPRA